MLLQFISGQGASFGPWVVNNSVKKMDDYTFLSGQCTCFASWIVNNIKKVVGLMSVLLQFLSGQGVSFGPWVVNNSVKWMITLFSVGSVHALLHGLSIISKRLLDLYQYYYNS